jgi:hypothetical protein
LRDLFEPNHEEFEETVENPSPKWTHLSYKQEFSQTNARLERYFYLFRRKILGGENY